MIDCISMNWTSYRPETRKVLMRRVLARHDGNLENLRELGKPLYRTRVERQNKVKPDKTNMVRTGGDIATITV